MRTQFIYKCYMGWSASSLHQLIDMDITGPDIPGFIANLMMTEGFITDNVSLETAGILSHFHGDLVMQKDGPLYGSSGILQILQLTYIILTFLIITVGNLTLFLLILRNRRLHRLSYCLLSLLALDGMWNSLATLPSAAVVMATRTPIQSDIWCQTQGVLHNSGTVFSIFILAMMSIENWVFICYPFKHRSIINKRFITTYVVCTMLLSVILSSLPPLLQILQPSNSEDQKNSTSGDQYVFHPGLLICCLYAEFSVDLEYCISLCCLSLFVTGGLTILVTQIQIYSTAHRHSTAIRRYQPNPAARTETNKLSAKLQIAKVISMVVGVYFSTWILYAIVVTIEETGQASDALVLVLMRIVALVVLTVPSSCHALLHAWRNQELQPYLKAALRWRHGPPSPRHRHTSSTALCTDYTDSLSPILHQNKIHDATPDKHQAEISPSSHTEASLLSPASTVTTELGDSPTQTNMGEKSPQSDHGEHEETDPEIQHLKHIIDAEISKL